MAHILIVDDDADIRLLLEKMLGGVENRAKAVAGGQEALDFVAGAIPDIIILDLMMPEMDGWQVLKELMSHERTRHIPVIIHSAVSGLEVPEIAFERGARDFWMKGKVNFIEMGHRIQAILNPSGERMAISQ